MLGKLFSLFSKRPAEEKAPQTPPSAAPAPEAKKPATSGAAPSASATAAPKPAAPAPAAPSGEMIALPLKPIIEALPKDLKESVSNAPSGDTSIKLPLNKVVEQLAKGNVKLTFGELRQLAPSGTFNGSDAHDQTMVVVPLKEVLSRVNPAQLKRRANQTQVDIPDDIKPVFGKDGKTEGAPAKAPEPAPAAKAPAAAPAPTPAPAAPAAPVPKPPSPPAAPAPAAAVPKPPAPASATPEPALAPDQPIKPAIPLPDPAKLAPTPKPPAPAPAVPKPPTPAAPAPAALPQEAGKIVIGLDSFSAGLVDPLKTALSSPHAAGTTFAIPVEDIDPLMKKGKITFAWKQLRSWSKPALPATVGAGNEEVQVELPLKIIIPLFMATRKPATAQKSVAVGENIPDVFAHKLGGATAAPEAPAAPAPAPVAAPVPAPPAAPSPAAPSVKTSVLGEIFGQPAKLEWSPAEIAQGTAKLDGVSGVILASPDGLKVASQLPAEVNADAFAGFVPAIFSRVGQYTKDINLGETTSLKVQMGAKPLYIFKSSKFYFAVLGRSGEAAPEAKLTKIATQLDQ